MQQIDNITLTHQQLVWLNRNQQKKVVANSKRASNGALILQQTSLVAGLPVVIGTLDGWMTRANFEALVTHNETNLEPFTLTMGDDVMSVIWDNTGVAIEGEDLYTQSSGCDTLTNVTLRFLTV